MIIKNFEIDKIKKTKAQFFLLYGDNQGFKNEIISLLKLEKKINADVYYEAEILKDISNFTNTILSKSFFDNEKFIVIRKSTDKIISCIEFLLQKKIDGTTIILEADILEKKSKLRTLFEKDIDLICIPFYPDNYQTLNSIALKYFRERKITVSNETINLIIDRANGQRQFLKTELNKIENYTVDKNKISFEEIKKITNLGNNPNVSELIDTCLNKNQNKLNNIINENILTTDDVILIIRVFLSKTKRLLKIKDNMKLVKNIDKVISSYKPPIFWKDKDIIKNQLKFWSRDEILNLINEINELEIKVKTNISQPIIILIDFLLGKAKS
tara:strand:- start:1313 stop:2296 length:984 start_codon:yes stop_codon:yes gene_type:complete